MIQEKPKAESCLSCSRIFASVMAEHEKAIETILRSYEDESAPKNDKSLLGTLGAVNTAIFVTAHFCDAHEVNNEIKRVRGYADAIRKRLGQLDAVTGLTKDVISRYLESDVSFNVSVIVYAAREKTGNIAPILARIPKRTVPVVRWNTQPSAFDFIHLKEGVPIDDENVAMRVEVYDMSTVDRTEAANVVNEVQKMIVN